VQAETVAATTGQTIRAIATTWQGVSPRTRLRSLLGLAAIVGLSALIVVLPIDYRALGNYGYLGVFVVTLVSTASLVLPVPYLATIVVAGSFLDPKLVALVAGVAAALGELTGYALGYTGRSLLPDNRWTAMIQQSMRRWGGPVLFVAAAIPNPFFDAVGMVAGATRMSIWVFMVSVFLGKALRFWLFAMMGLTFIHG
jgi:membrane protein YqaA with SNARE-associated domain